MENQDIDDLEVLRREYRAFLTFLWKLDERKQRKSYENDLQSELSSTYLTHGTSPFALESSKIIESFYSYDNFHYGLP